MKRKEAIKQIQEGKIQVFNDLLPSTKEIKKFLKEAFPEDDFRLSNTYILNKFFKQDGCNTYMWFSTNTKGVNLPTINLSTITKRKKTKLSQLEKQFSELAKDVSELRQILTKDVEVDVEETQQETIKEEEIDWIKQAELIAKKYVYGNHNALTDRQEVEDIKDDIILLLNKLKEELTIK